MTDSDLKAYKLWDSWSKRLSVNTIGLLSCNQQQHSIINNLFPDANIIQYTINSWNLKEKISTYHDLIVACNVFHYSNNPKLWFSNVLSCTKTLWIQDIINRKRGIDYELGYDGDSMRYYYKNHNSLFPNATNLEDLGTITNFFYYISESNNEHFLAEIKKDEH